MATRFIRMSAAPGPHNHSATPQRSKGSKTRLDPTRFVQRRGTAASGGREAAAQARASGAKTKTREPPPPPDCPPSEALPAPPWQANGRGSCAPAPPTPPPAPEASPHGGRAERPERPPAAPQPRTRPTATALSGPGDQPPSRPNQCGAGGGEVRAAGGTSRGLGGRRRKGCDSAERRAKGSRRPQRSGALGLGSCGAPTPFPLEETWPLPRDHLQRLRCPGGSRACWSVRPRWRRWGPGSSGPALGVTTFTA
ncbi:uncharacterized protein [Notamacropus eugenii]|uniref:uncharacterized protein n=1 Tax=Notamacropus eugenii TaxID=9315 RepID=UPI003B676329